MSKTPIQWHAVNDGQVPNTVAGDHVYFTPSGIYVNDANGVVHKVSGNYDKQINVLNNSGCNGTYAGIEDFTDYNLLTDVGIFHCVYIDAKLNEPVQISGSRRITIMNFKTPDGAYFQRIRYDDGAGSGEIYERFNNKEWIQIATVDMIESLEARITDLENAISTSSLSLNN